VEGRTSPKGIPALVGKQARDLYLSCEKGSLRDTLIAARWHNYNLGLGIVSILSAGIAAFLRSDNEILQSLPYGLGPHIAPSLAVISATLTSILTFLAPSEKASAYHHFSNKFRSLRDRVRCFIEVECGANSKDAIVRDKYERLVREKVKLIRVTQLYLSGHIKRRTKKWRIGCRLNKN
jgi:hypothetical protein